MVEARIQTEITKIPKRTQIDFFAAMAVSSLFAFDKLFECYEKRTIQESEKRMAPKGCVNPPGAFI
jgi:hypothetical protein